MRVGGGTCQLGVSRGRAPLPRLRLARPERAGQPASWRRRPRRDDDDDARVTRREHGERRKLLVRSPWPRPRPSSADMLRGGPAICSHQFLTVAGCVRVLARALSSACTRASSGTRASCGRRRWCACERLAGRRPPERIALAQSGGRSCSGQAGRPSQPPPGAVFVSPSDWAAAAAATTIFCCWRCPFGAGS
jgi:hypothetical protein